MNHRHPMTAALDLALCMLLVFLIIAISAANTKTVLPTPGVYAATATWKSGSNDDVDLWMRDPQGGVCFFATPSIDLMHLERDDLGTAVSGTQIIDTGQKVVIPQNIERIVVTGATPGWYVVNIFLYNRADPGPIEVTVALWSIARPEAPLVQVTITLSHNGEQRTAFRFHIGPHGEFLGYDHLPTDLTRANAPAAVGGQPPNLP